MSTFFSPIQESLQGAVVFITGGTGYVGSGIIEKLLRSTPNIKKIYLLIRPKKNKTVETRLDELFEGPYWKILKRILPNYKEYVTTISGELFDKDLGLSECDKQLIMTEVTHIFHLAATVRFDEKLKKAIAINVIGTKCILELAGNCQRLKSIVHVSTAYAHCYLPDLNESFYDPITNLDEFLEFSNSKTEKELDDMTPSIIGNFPNTYTFTKSMAEALVRKYEYKLPICIVRPSIVMGSWQEPLPGWVNNMYGPIGIIIGTGLGIIHAIYVKMNLITDVVPIDLTANCIIAASWNNCSTNYRQNPTPIFNIVTNKRNPLTWKTMLIWSSSVMKCYYPSQAIWAYFCIETGNKKVFKYLTFFLHVIPAHIADAGMQIIGKKPLFVKLYEKVHNLHEVVSFFTDRQWQLNDEKTVDLFESLNVRDKITYNFDITTIEWDLYIIHLIKMLRTHILKDPLSTTPAAQKRRIILNVIHYSVIFLLLLILYSICYLISKIFF